MSNIKKYILIAALIAQSITVAHVGLTAYALSIQRQVDKASIKTRDNNILELQAQRQVDADVLKFKNATIDYLKEAIYMLGVSKNFANPQKGLDDNLKGTDI